MALAALRGTLKTTAPNETLPILQSLAVATRDVLQAIHRWREDLWIQLPFLYKGTNYADAMVTDVTDVLLSSSNATAFFFSDVKLNSHGRFITSTLLSRGLDLNTLAFLLPRCANLTETRAATALLNEASLVATTQRVYKRLLRKGVFTPRLRWPRLGKRMLHLDSRRHDA